MTERELRAVAEAIAKADDGSYGDYDNAYHEIAKAAISASDSKYVKGLVEALKDAKKALYETDEKSVLLEKYIPKEKIWDYSRNLYNGESYEDDARYVMPTQKALCSAILSYALQNLPEDLR